LSTATPIPKKMQMTSRCPACYEKISVKAKVCFHCGRNIWVAKWLPLKSENFAVISTNILLVLATLLTAWIAHHSSANNLALSRRSLVLQLRPFVAVANPSFTFHPDPGGNRFWLTVDYSVINLGEQPAHDYVRRNDKVMVISTPSNILEELVRLKNDPNSTVTQKDVAYQNIMTARRATIEELYTYLRGHPMASFNEINQQFSQRGVHCYGDIVELFPPPTLLLPRELKPINPSRSGRDVGSDYGQEFAQGKSALVYYVFLAYEGATPDAVYSTFYIGYYDELLSQKYQGKAEPNRTLPLIEYRQWIHREPL